MRKITLICCTTLSVLMFGCAHSMVREGPGPGVRIRHIDAPQAQIRWNSVAIIDDSLENWHGREWEKKGKIAVEATNARRTPTGTVEVWATLRNRTDFPLQIEGRTQFFDSGKAPVEGPTAWQRVFLPPNAVAAYKETSTKVMEIGYYYIEIREGR